MGSTIGYPLMRELLRAPLPGSFHQQFKHFMDFRSYSYFAWQITFKTHFSQVQNFTPDLIGNYHAKSVFSLYFGQSRCL